MTPVEAKRFVRRMVVLTISNAVFNEDWPTRYEQFKQLSSEEKRMVNIAVTDVLKELLDWRDRSEERRGGKEGRSRWAPDESI